MMKWRKSQKIRPHGPESSHTLVKLCCKFARIDSLPLRDLLNCWDFIKKSSSQMRLSSEADYVLRPPFCCEKWLLFVCIRGITDVQVIPFALAPTLFWLSPVEWAVPKKRRRAYRSSFDGIYEPHNIRNRNWWILVGEIMTILATSLSLRWFWYERNVKMKSPPRPTSWSVLPLPISIDQYFWVAPWHLRRRPTASGGRDGWGGSVQLPSYPSIQHG